MPTCLACVCGCVCEFNLAIVLSLFLYYIGENCSSAAHREVTQTARYASAPARSDSSTFDDDPKQMYKVLDSCLVATDSTSECDHVGMYFFL